MSPVPPRMASKDLRPRRRWFAVALLIPPTVVGIGLLLLTLTGMNAFRSYPPPEFLSGQVQGTGSSTVDLTTTDLDSVGLYIRPTEADGAACSMDGPGTAWFAEREVNHGWDGWRLEYALEVDTPGSYTLTCRGSSDVSFVVAETRTAQEADRRGLTTALTLFGGFALGVLGMFVMIITVGILRGTYPSRVAERARRNGGRA
ncbi:hypothetical protein DSY14_27985 [Nocardiopsis sp. MG754419]|nr:hypothetical protein [Nocardiopsis sp. MG754419]